MLLTFFFGMFFVNPASIMAIVLSWGAIVLYLWLRFGSIQWGLAAVICLIHDVIIVVGLVATLMLVLFMFFYSGRSCVFTVLAGGGGQ